MLTRQQVKGDQQEIQRQKEKERQEKEKRQQEKDTTSAVISGNVNEVKRLLDRGVNINMKDPDHGNCGLLEIACKNQYPIEVIKELLHRKINVNEPFTSGSLALTFVMMSDKDEVLDRLLNCDSIDINLKDDESFSPLRYAVILNHVDCVQKLLEKGADGNITDEDKNTTLHWAVMHRSSDACFDKLLQSQSIDLNLQNNDGMTPLHYAVTNAIPTFIRKLIHKGADMNKKDQFGRTALHHAVILQNPEVLNVLLESLSIQVDVKDHFGLTPLQYVVTTPPKCGVNWKAIDVIKKLVGRGANKDIQDKVKRTLLHLAAMDPASPLVGSELLESYQFDINLQDIHGATALHYAAHERKKLFVSSILKIPGVDKDVQDKNGCTPLHIAMRNGDQFIIGALKIAGASEDIKDVNNRTPQQYYKVEKKSKVINPHPAPKTPNPRNQGKSIKGVPDSSTSHQVPSSNKTSGARGGSGVSGSGVSGSGSGSGNGTGKDTRKRIRSESRSRSGRD